MMDAGRRIAGGDWRLQGSCDPALSQEVNLGLAV